jgi:hypothetical protein
MSIIKILSSSKSFTKDPHPPLKFFIKVSEIPCPFIMFYSLTIDTAKHPSHHGLPRENKSVRTGGRSKRFERGWVVDITIGEAVERPRAVVLDLEAINLGTYALYPVPVGGNDNQFGNSSQSFNLALGCFLTSKIVRNTSGMAHQMARDPNNVGDHGKLCNSIYSVCIRDVDVF